MLIRLNSHDSYENNLTISTNVQVQIIEVTNGPVSQQSYRFNESTLPQLFPCLHPSHPHLRTLNARLDTFGYGWQPSRIRASPRQLAESGLYYLGK